MTVNDHLLPSCDSAVRSLDSDRAPRKLAVPTISSDYQVTIDRRLARIWERHGFAEDAMQKRRVVASTLATAAKKVIERTGQLPLLLLLRGSDWSCHPGYLDGSGPTTKQVFHHLASRNLHLALLAFGCEFLCPQAGDSFGYDAASSRTWQC